MARIRRLVVPGYPHQVTQRGSRRQKTFFNEQDYKKYIALLAAAKVSSQVAIWAYCLMPNHVHFVVVPYRADSLADLFRDAHRRYTREINLRNGWRGHLWQERFNSFVMDEPHLMSAVRYVELNPVRAGLCGDPAHWPWSSARAHLRGCDDLLVDVDPMLKRSPNWPRYLGGSPSDELIENLRRHSSTGRPAGDSDFVDTLARLSGRRLRPGKAGRKKGSR